MRPAVRVDEGQDGSGRLADPEIARRTRTGLAFAEELDARMAAATSSGSAAEPLSATRISNSPRSRLCASRLARQVSSMSGWLRCGMMTDTKGLPDFTLKILRPGRTRRGGMWPANTGLSGRTLLYSAGAILERGAGFRKSHAVPTAWRPGTRQQAPRLPQ